MNITKMALLGILFILSSQVGSAQKALSIQGNKIKQKEIYFLLDNDSKIKYFTGKEGPDSRQPIGASVKFSLKNNFANIYFKWLNPIRYRFTWKDTVFIDERDQAVNNFTSLLVGQFGTSISALNQNKNNSTAAVALAMQSQRKTAITPSSKTSKPGKSANGQIDTIRPKITIPIRGFNSMELTLLFIELQNNESNLSNDEIIRIDTIENNLQNLDELNVVDYSSQTDGIFTNLYNVTDPGKVESSVLTANNQIVGINNKFTVISDLQTSLTQAISNFTLINPLLKNYTKSTVTSFLNQTATNLTTNKNIIAKLQPILDLMSNSIKTGDESKDQKGFFRIRDISFDDGKELETSLAVSEYTYNPTAKTFDLKSSLAQSNITFQKYDFFVISVSTGLFYSNATLKGYGVSSGANNQFTVTETDLQQSAAIPAVFLNFNFGTGSRYFSPLFQIGADPTKLHPFLLIGGGFSIPSANISITGGPLWTFNQSLSTLTIGQSVSSTSALTSDIKYTFNVNPVGWYLGIQYNF